MKKLEFNQIEQIQGGMTADQQETCIYASGTIMAIGIATAFTGAGAALVFGGALLGYACS